MKMNVSSLMELSDYKKNKLYDSAPKDLEWKMSIRKNNTHIDINFVNNISNNDKILEYLKNFTSISFYYCSNFANKLHEGLNKLYIFNHHHIYEKKNNYEKYDNLPSTLKVLKIFSNNYDCIDNLPQNLEFLSLFGHVSLDNLPENLRVIKICYSYDTEIKQYGIDNLPDSIENIILDNIIYINFKINKLPKSLKNIYMINSDDIGYGYDFTKNINLLLPDKSILPANSKITYVEDNSKLYNDLVNYSEKFFGY